MKSKKNLFRGKNGVSTQILSSSIKNIQKTINSKQFKNNQNEKRKLKNSYQKGKCITPDLYDLSIGMEAADHIISKGLDVMTDNMMTGKSNINSIRVGLIMSNRIISHIMKSMGLNLRNAYYLESNIKNIKKYSEITQAARDGLILKQEKRLEDGVYKKYDVPISEGEITEVLERYEIESRELKHKKVLDYARVGASALAILGTVMRECEQGNDTRDSHKIITIGSIVTNLIILSSRLIPKNDLNNSMEYRDKARQQYRSLLNNEQVSHKSIENKLNSFEVNTKTGERLDLKYGLKVDLVYFISKLSTTLFSGMYIANGMKNSGSKKLDAKLLSSLLINLSSCKDAVGQLSDVIEDVLDSKESFERLDKLYEKIQNIESQMEEKVYVLQGATTSFNSFKIENLHGKFYPNKNYETGEVTYGTQIEVPEFSMKKGDVVLLSGKSGAGKSTFLRLLKRGDVNNRKCIELDNGEKVDNLGQEYISFRPSINLGNETTVLEEITGKENISDLSEEERIHLKKIMGDLELDSDNIIDTLATRKFMQFSTGQQRRLALSKVFYETTESTSVLIVDEPVGNVEDRLIREQLKLIRDIAKKNNLMLILVTHRTELANDLVNKRYHISEDGVMKELSVEREEKYSNDLEEK